ncbi:alpha-2-macroglobulin family protein [Chitiniphilus purpureus]|uniref:Alpha-2-macroglobulin family protein n=1 Tax=Chitiniphilus purpureus TaxID=2981137 RepID=A0ABY6DR41_9NEIS|nr:alpha-2-macroglobulin [Chitiniphilus sp. CD1]UXY16845.1 alpha-2-macroglobulin family protein [Chitiniphilus sp. CD1]
MKTWILQRNARKLGLGALLVLLVAAAIGGWWWGQRSGAGPANAGLPPALPDSEFAVLGCKAGYWDDAPALAISFSRPLLRKQALDQLFQVTDLGVLPEDKAASAPVQKPKAVSGEWVLDDEARTAYFASTAKRRYAISLKPGLRSDDHARIDQGHRCEVALDAMPPAYYFASRGVVLPASQNGGLPVVTVNVPEVDVQFLRVAPQHIPRFLAQVVAPRRADRSGGEQEDGEGEGGDGSQLTLSGAVSGWTLQNLKRITQSVYLGRFLTDPRPHRRNVSFLPVENIKELQAPGIYVAVMSQPGRFGYEYQVTYFYVTDIGLHVHRGHRQIDAFATSLKHGEALSGVSFELLDTHGKVLAHASGDGEGHAVLADVPDSARALVARKGEQLATLALFEPGLDLSEYDIGGHLPRNAKLFAYSGRDLYRPGERFFVSVLARDTDGRPLPALPLTATLKRPDGQTVQSATWQPDSKLPGYYQRQLALPADAQTGTWLLELRADPAAKSADTVLKLQVEEFLPERMKLALQAAVPAAGALGGFDVAVQGAYLFGSPASGNRLLGTVFAERLPQALPRQWPGFLFGDFADDERKQRRELEEVALDEAGRASVTVPLELAGAKSPMLARASFSLLESGGRPVVRSIEHTLWPAEAMVGIRPLFDRDVARENDKAAFELVRVTQAGVPAPPVTAKVRLIREDRDFYWRHDDQRGWHSGYTETDQPVYSGTVLLKGRAALALPVTWGRYRLEVEDPDTRLAARYRFYAGWGAQDAEAMGNRPDRVNLKLAGVPAKPGGQVRLTILPPHDGEALVMVEGDKVLWRKRVSVSAKGTEVDIPVAADWKRHDLYVSVVAFRPGSKGDRVTPARALGLAYLPLASAERKFRLALAAPRQARPQTRVPVKLKLDVPDSTAFVTLSAVDVGILNITRFKTPDPFDFLFGKHRYGQDLADLYGKLIEKMEGNAGKLKWGGDSAMRGSQERPSKVKLVDLFSGPVRFDAKGEATVMLDIPDFNGTLRLMAVAASASRYGNAEAELTVAAPVVAELATPRFISPGDQATLALDVTNLTGATQTFTVRLSAGRPVRIREGEQKITLKDKERRTLRYTADATDAYGLARLDFSVAGRVAGKPLLIKRDAALQVQPPLPLERNVTRVKLDPGAEQAVGGEVIARYHADSAAVTLTVSNTPPLNVRSLIKGLLDYPYGCLEQTTSAAYPHLFVDEAAARSYGLTPRTREERARFIEGALARIAGMQQSDGGYSLWGGGGGSGEPWLSAYVAGFYQDAREAGFAVPDMLYRRTQDWLLTQLQQAPADFPGYGKRLADKLGEAGVVKGTLDGGEYEQLRMDHQRFAAAAHQGYVLARDQKAPLATLRVLFDKYAPRARSPLALVQLGLALKLMGDQKRAAAAFELAFRRPYGIAAAYDGGWGEWLGDYGSAVRDRALAYALLVRHGITHPQRENMLYELADTLKGTRGAYYSTQERLALLLAARAAGTQAQGEWQATLQTGASARTLSGRHSQSVTLDAAQLAQGVKLVNRHGGPLFAEIEASGYLRELPKPRGEEIQLERRWFFADGKPYDGRALKVGETLIARLQVSARQRIEDGLIVDRIPAGLEIENLNLSDGERLDRLQVEGRPLREALQDERVKHREFRDDRFVAAARIDGSRLALYYLLRVVTPGRFVVPPSYAEDMYRPQLIGIGAASPAITVTDPRG